MLAGINWNAVWLTTQLAAVTTISLCLIGLPLAYWLANSRHPIRYMIEAVVALPLVLPPTVLGFYLLVALGPQSPIGRFADQWFGVRLPFSFGGILIGSILFNLPFAVRPFTSAFAGLNTQLVEASWCLGVSRLETFRRVALPLCWPGVLAGIVLTFSHTIGEFGVVLMLGGNIPGKTRTLSVSIYDSVQSLDYASAGQTSLFLLAFAFLSLCLTQWLSRQGASV